MRTFIDNSYQLYEWKLRHSFFALSRLALFTCLDMNVQIICSHGKLYRSYIISLVAEAQDNLEPEIIA